MKKTVEAKAQTVDKLENPEEPYIAFYDKDD